MAALAALLAVAGATRAARAADAIADAAVRFLPAEQAIRIEGALGPRLDADVRTALATHPDARRLVITSPGGMRAPAMRVAELANAHGLVVRIAGRCASACALLWAAAERREMTYDSGLGLHRSALDPSLALPDVLRRRIMARNDRQTDDVLRQAGFPERVIAAGAATPAESMSWFSPYELRTGGVPFVLLDGAGHAAALDVATGHLVDTSTVAR
ncbi:MAG TPA: hypothetical protein VFE72_12580 [Lysobacter sp.]|nr:hypothetical protein [Lysobacter sp.]